jgi:FkbM family methyltransferase
VIGSKTILMQKKWFIQIILNLMGFKIISGHWVYCRGILKKSIILDFGANNGSFSRKMEKSFEVQGFALEPNLNLFSKLDVPNITPLKYAVSKIDAPINFYISNNEEASSILKDFENVWETKEINIVEGIRWQSLIRLLNLEDKRITLIKVDIEGAELELIESFTYENLSNVEQITIEFHDWLNVSLHEKTIAAIQKLCNFGFQTITNTPNHLWPVEILFINTHFIKFNFIQNLLFYFYKKVTFLKYNFK